MPTYATAADCESYISGLVIDNPESFDSLIERAEKDVDRVATSWWSGDGNLKFTPNLMAVYQQNALRDATCAQVEYRLAKGAQFFIEQAPKSVTGPDYSQEGREPRIGPKVKEELQRGGLLLTTARVR